MKFVKRFKTETDYNSYIKSDRLILPNISLIDEVSEMSEEDSGVRFNPLPPYDPYNGHEYVDLGLPSGTLWAKCNVGAEKESDYGLYFQWGDVVGYKDASSGKIFDQSNYKYYRGSNNTLTKYNTSSSHGVVDNLTALEPSDDAATVNMGGSWHMPSKEQCKELINSSYTTTTWTWANGINGRIYGRLITSKTNGNTLFLPASGSCDSDFVGSLGSSGYYWSSSLYEDYPSSAWYLYFYSGYIGVKNSDRCSGRTVRGVID